MAKYIFSKGKIYVEEGVYRPILNRTSQLSDAKVLIVLQNGYELSQTEKTTQDKEKEENEKKQP